MTWQHFLFSFEGRISRRAYWSRFLLPIIIVVLMALIAMDPTTPGAFVLRHQETLFWPMAALQLVCLWPVVAVGAKRCHDRGRSGWFQLVGFVPVVGPFWLFVELALLRGTSDANRFGPDPA